LDHIHYYQQARSLSSGGEVFFLCSAIGLGILTLLGPIFGICCFLPNNDAALGFCVGLSSTGALGTCAVGFFILYWQHKLRRHRQYERLMDMAERTTKKSCVQTGPAVSYEGWYGTIHTFRFASDQFADAFMAANHAKIVP
jgi:hypothetical protein